MPGASAIQGATMNSGDINIDLLAALGRSLASTLALEIGFYLVVCYISAYKISRVDARTESRTDACTNACTNGFIVKKFYRKDLMLIVMANILTNPTVVLLYWLAVLYTGLNLTFTVAVLESSAVLSEGIIYKKHGRNFIRPWLFSIYANVFSYGTGLLIQTIIRECFIK